MLLSIQPSPGAFSSLLLSVSRSDSPSATPFSSHPHYLLIVHADSIYRIKSMLGQVTKDQRVRRSNLDRQIA